MMVANSHGCAKEPGTFLAALKEAGERWTPIQAARLVMGDAADSIRDEMGEHWLLVAMTAHLADARKRSEWSFAHTAMQAWVDYQADRLDEHDYRRRLAESAEDGMRQFCCVT
jgi:hypothetical protein